ncbi:hypothetical protein OH76DRAFT_1404924 [Lentinus brumalis]|uniref:Uncharacterized protein n=1 Tax=Lentinus brumalis TaxID=2498619 RepID=A0A371D766_9APHY|nr:hypothetical protein OH76DRAFT_1404924 [Polyporus brumalis]
MVLPGRGLWACCGPSPNRVARGVCGWCVLLPEFISSHDRVSYHCQNPEGGSQHLGPSCAVRSSEGGFWAQIIFGCSGSRATTSSTGPEASNIWRDESKQLELTATGLQWAPLMVYSCPCPRTNEQLEVRGPNWQLPRPTCPDIKGQDMHGKSSGGLSFPLLSRALRAKSQEMKDLLGLSHACPCL